MQPRSLASLVAAALLLVGCSSDAAPAPARPASGPLAPFLASAAPADAQSVLAVRKSAVAGAEITVVGRAKDFVAGRAVFTLIDPSLRACSDEGDPMADSCETPWDYCCIDPGEVGAASATIEFRDSAGVIKSDLQGFGGLDHLDTVFVRGAAEKDEAGNLTLVVKSFYFEKNTR